MHLTLNESFVNVSALMKMPLRIYFLLRIISSFERLEKFYIREGMRSINLIRRWMIWFDTIVQGKRNIWKEYYFVTVYFFLFLFENNSIVIILLIQQIFNQHWNWKIVIMHFCFILFCFIILFYLCLFLFISKILLLHVTRIKFVYNCLIFLPYRLFSSTVTK